MNLRILIGIALISLLSACASTDYAETVEAKYPPIRAADYLAIRLEATYAPKAPVA